VVIAREQLLFLVTLTLLGATAVSSDTLAAWTAACVQLVLDVLLFFCFGAGRFTEKRVLFAVPPPSSLRHSFSSVLYDTDSLLFFATQLLFFSLRHSFSPLLHDTDSLLFFTTQLLFFSLRHNSSLLFFYNRASLFSRPSLSFLTHCRILLDFLSV
jgi:hypothetical protein